MFYPVGRCGAILTRATRPQEQPRTIQRQARPCTSTRRCQDARQPRGLRSAICRSGYRASALDRRAHADEHPVPIAPCESHTHRPFYRVLGRLLEVSEMSFQLYVQSFTHGEPSGFTRDELRQAFSGVLVELEEDYWQADFGANGSSNLFLSFMEDGSDRIHNLSIDHPSIDDRLWQAIWILLAVPGTVFHFPGAVSALARDPDAGTSLPPEMRNVLGQPITISHFKAISQSLDAA